MPQYPSLHFSAWPVLSMPFLSWLLFGPTVPDTHWLVILLVIQAVFITFTDFLKFCVFGESYHFTLQSVFVYTV